MIIVNIMKPSWGILTHWQLSNDTKNMAQAMSSGRCQHVSINTNKQTTFLHRSITIHVYQLFVKGNLFCKTLIKMFCQYLVYKMYVFNKH